MFPETTPQTGFTPMHQVPAENGSLAAGYSAGYSAGWSAGSRAAAKEAAALRHRLAEEAAERARQASAAAEQAMSTLAQAAAAARARTAPVLDEADGALTRAAVMLAEALLGTELRDDEASARSALARALTVQDTDIVRIRLHPADLTHLSATLDSLPDELRLPKDVELVADAELERGDAVCELAEGYLDARLSTALARVRSALELA